MSSAYSASLEKLKSYNSYKRPIKHFRASRSINPMFPNISKLDDVTRFNSANCNVYFYKDYPNRALTPIKSICPKKPLCYKAQTSQKQQFITTFMNDSYISPEGQKKIVKNAMAADLRIDRSPPRFNVVSAGTKAFVMNDFHKRETNAGFARNGSGGFYTR